MKNNNIDGFNELVRTNVLSLQESYESLNSAMRNMIEFMDDDPRKEEYVVMWSMINDKFQTIFDKL